MALRPQKIDRDDLWVVRRQLDGLGAVRNGLGRLARPLVGNCSVKPGGRGRRVQCDGLGEIGKGLIQPILAGKSHAPVFVGSCVFWIEFDGLGEIVNGLP